MYLFSVFLSVTFRYFLMVIALHLYRIIEKLFYLALHQIITQLSRLKDVGSEMYLFFSFSISCDKATAWVNNTFSLNLINI